MNDLSHPYSDKKGSSDPPFLVPFLRNKDGETLGSKVDLLVVKGLASALWTLFATWRGGCGGEDQAGAETFGGCLHKGRKILALEGGSAQRHMFFLFSLHAKKCTWS